jgi:hypothetical protein
MSEISLKMSKISCNLWPEEIFVKIVLTVCNYRERRNTIR